MRKALTIEDLLKSTSVDWNALSRDSTQLCEPLTVRYFAKDINWNLYLLTHENSINSTILEYGSKYFNKENYSLACQLGYIDEDFINQHLEDINFKDIILYCKVTDEFLVAHLDYWKSIPNVLQLFKLAREFNVETFPQTSVVLKTL